MTDPLARLAERLREEGQKTEEFFRLLTPEQLEWQLYEDGSHWNVRQLLAHFVTAEAGFLLLIENILTGGPGAAPDFDIDLFNEQQVAGLAQVPFNNLIQRFIQQRAATLELVSHMQPEDLLRMGRHPFLGIASLQDILKLIYRHNQIHQRDVRKILSMDSQV